jgi:hypothetical protein
MVSRAAGNTTAGDLTYVTGMVSTAGAVPASFFDGATPTAGDLQHYWAGTVNASESVETSPTAGPGVWLSLPATAAPNAGTVSAVPLEMILGYDETSESNGSLHTIIGRADKLANPGPLALRSGTLELWLSDYAHADALRNLLASGEIAQVRQPDFPGLDLYLSTRSLEVHPDTQDTETRRWIGRLAYEEVLAP